MFFSVENGRITEADEKVLNEDISSIAIFKKAEWEKYEGIKSELSLNREIEDVKFTKIENGIDYQYINIFIPPGDGKENDIYFSIYMVNKAIILIDDTGFVEKKISFIINNGAKKEYSIEKLFSEFMLHTIRDDTDFLEKIEADITKLEEAVLRGGVKEFNQKMLKIKKLISKLHRHYKQMVELGDTFIENEKGFFDDNQIHILDSFVSKAERLQSETLALREYSNQVHEVHQSEIDIRQNYVMKVLTVITAIFLPLTLLVGWYGMNFKHMPELEWIYGYNYVMVLSVIIVVVCLWLFSKNKFW